jgi:hypothetical protein
MKGARVVSEMALQEKCTYQSSRSRPILTFLVSTTACMLVMHTAVAEERATTAQSEQANIAKDAADNANLASSAQLPPTAPETTLSVTVPPITITKPEPFSLSDTTRYRLELATGYTTSDTPIIRGTFQASTTLSVRSGPIAAGVSLHLDGHGNGIASLFGGVTYSPNNRVTFDLLLETGIHNYYSVEDPKFPSLSRNGGGNATLPFIGVRLGATFALSEPKLNESHATLGIHGFARWEPKGATDSYTSAGGLTNVAFGGGAELGIMLSIGMEQVK